MDRTSVPHGFVIGGVEDKPVQDTIDSLFSRCSGSSSMGFVVGGSHMLSSFM